MLLKLLLIILGANEHTSNQRDSTLFTGDGSAVSGSTDTISEDETNGTGKFFIVDRIVK